MMMSERPNYYSILPADVRYADIPPTAKLLYSEITSLTNAYGYCFATNDYFAELYGVHKKSISRLIKSLEDARFIKIEMTYKKDSKEIEFRKIRLEQLPAPPEQICGYPRNKFEEDNTTSINKEKEKKEKKENLLFSPKEIGYKDDQIYTLADNVKMKGKEYKKLIEKYGEIATGAMIEKLSVYKKSKGRRYKNDYAAILNWVVDWYHKNQTNETFKGNNDAGDYEYEV